MISKLIKGYEDLPEKEKESNRKEADKFLNFFKKER